MSKLDAFDRIAKKTKRSRAEVIETWSERAAIREYLGGIPRVKAELAAIEDTEELLGGIQNKSSNARHR